MEMRICVDCGAVFKDDHKTDTCGVCGGDLVKAKRCPCCDNYMSEEDLICPACADSTKKTLFDALATLDPEQVKYLDELSEGTSLLEFWRNN